MVAPGVLPLSLCAMGTDVADCLRTPVVPSNQFPCTYASDGDCDDRYWTAGPGAEFWSPWPCGARRVVYMQRDSDCPRASHPRDTCSND